jgi:hypothetical protein
MNASAGRTGDSQDAPGAREALVEKIVAQIRRQGYFLAHLDPHPYQDIIDLRWAAQMAGRALDRRTRCYASSVGAKRPEKLTVIVAPTEVRSVAEIRRRDCARAVIEDLLKVHSLVPSRWATA